MVYMHVQRVYIGVRMVMQVYKGVYKGYMIYGLTYLHRTRSVAAGAEALELHLGLKRKYKIQVQCELQC